MTEECVVFTAGALIWYRENQPVLGLSLKSTVGKDWTQFNSSELYKWKKLPLFELAVKVPVCIHIHHTMSLCQVSCRWVHKILFDNKWKKHVVCVCVCVCGNNQCVLVLKSDTLPWRAEEPVTSQSGTERVEKGLRNWHLKRKTHPDHTLLDWSQVSSTTRHPSSNHWLRTVSWHGDLFFLWGRSHKVAVCTPVLIGQRQPHLVHLLHVSQAVVFHVGPHIPLLQTVCKRTVPNIVALLLFHDMNTHIILLWVGTWKRQRSHNHPLFLLKRFH